jgi:hypothetical protein
MMYLKQTSIGPLAGGSFAKIDVERSEAEATLTSGLKFMVSLKKKGQLFGCSKDDKISINTDVDLPEAYPESVIFNGRKNGDSSIYHYTITRPSKDDPWKLQKAWQTDAKGRVVEEYPVP